MSKLFLRLLAALLIPLLVINSSPAHFNSSIRTIQTMPHDASSLIDQAISPPADLPFGRRVFLTSVPFWITLGASLLCGASDVPTFFKEHLTAAKIQKDIQFLSSRSFKGRSYGSEENRRVAEYLANRLKKTGIPVLLDPVDQFGPIQGYSVIGTLKGSNSNVSDEMVVLCAHFDHLSPEMDPLVIFPGADDNASGTSALLAVAEANGALAREGQRPRRTMVFAFFNGEEGGLRGSHSFVSHLGDQNLAHVKQVINMDMVGWRNPFYPNRVRVLGNIPSVKEELAWTLAGNPPLWKGGVLPQNPILQEIVIEAIEVMQLGIEPYFAPFEMFERSDNYSFYNDGKVSVVRLHDGGYGPYHSILDTSNRVDAAFTSKIAQLAAYLAWKIATATDRLPAYHPLLQPMPRVISDADLRGFIRELDDQCAQIQSWLNKIVWIHNILRAPEPPPAQDLEHLLEIRKAYQGALNPLVYLPRSAARAA